MKHAVPSVLLGLLVSGLAGPARAQDDEKLVVVTTLPYLADLVKELAGDKAEVSALCPAAQDPHVMVPTPQQSVALSKAHVYIENGMQLELWSERVIDGARNANIRPGFPGHCYATTGVAPLQVPAQVSRAFGDVHPAGNPHVWYDPLNLKVVARNIAVCLGRVRPAWQPALQKRLEALQHRIDEAYFGADLVKIIGGPLLERLQRTGRLRGFLAEKQFQGKPLKEKAGGWLARAQALGALKFISYHQDYTYLAHAFGFECAGTIEEKPGIPPSPGHLEQLAKTGKAVGVQVVVCAPFYPLSRAEAVGEQLGVPAILVPAQPRDVEGADDVFKMFDVIFQRLEGAVKPAGAPR
jgi:zinc/manganese transport system substrate-binding protein